MAADYLVMAAWLAFLKSRLLLPPEPGEDGPSAEDLAAHLAFQLERLQAMRDVAARLMARDQLGRDFFPRGLPEGISLHRKVSYDATLLDLMRAYARIRTKDEFRPFVMDRETCLHAGTGVGADARVDRLCGRLGRSDQLSARRLGRHADGAALGHRRAFRGRSGNGQARVRWRSGRARPSAPIQIRRRDA